MVWLLSISSYHLHLVADPDDCSISLDDYATPAYCILAGVVLFWNSLSTVPPVGNPESMAQGNRVALGFVLPDALWLKGFFGS